MRHPLSAVLGVVLITALLCGGVAYGQVRQSSSTEQQVALAAALTANIVVNPHCDGTMNVDATYSEAPTVPTQFEVSINGGAPTTYVDDDGDLMG